MQTTRRGGEGLQNALKYLKINFDVSKEILKIVFETELKSTQIKDKDFIFFKHFKTLK